LLSDQPIGVSGSTQGNPDPRSSPLAALDGDEGTTWTASLSDVTPTLRLNWIGKHRVRGLDLSVAADTAARLPEELVVTWPGGRRDVRVNKRGEARFPPVRTDQLAVRVKEAEPATSLGFDSAGASVPVGIGEMRVLGLPLVPIVLPTQQVRFPCGSGPDVWVNRHIIRTSVTASPVELYGGATVPAKLCTAQDVSLDAGENQVDALGSDAFVPTALVLSRTGMTYVPPPHPVSIAWSDPARMTIDLDDPARLVTVRENRNLGWRAVQRGRVLEPVTVDGWQQGWRLSGSSAALHVTFQPDRDYRWGLLGGLAAVLVLAVLCAVPRRRWAETPGGPLGSGVPPLPVVGGVVVLAGGSLAGWLGALVAGGSFVLASVLNRRAPEVGPWILGGAVLPAAVAYAFRPWGGSGGWAGGLDWPHYLVVVACAAVLAWPAGGGRRPRSFRRIPGRSTRR
jgi:arabinofuranan 3-O-arabinosyltransferase